MLPAKTPVANKKDRRLIFLLIYLSVTDFTSGSNIMKHRILQLTADNIYYFLL